jgi:hypothetical protein
MGQDRLVGQQVVVGEWDYSAEELPAWVEGLVVKRKAEDTYLVSLKRPIVVAGKAERTLVLTGRHLGYPVTGIRVGPLRSLVCRSRLLARLFAPLVAVNVTTEGGHFFAIALIYLRSLFIRAGGRLPGDGPGVE